MKSKGLFAILLFCSLHTSAQVGGDNTYEFLNLPWSAYGSALGGSIVSLTGENPSFISGNPSLANRSMSGTLSLGYASYLAGISFGSAEYIFDSSGKSTLAAGLNWLNYGSFVEADNAGNITGKFKAAEYALSFIYSRIIDSIFSVGINIKPVISQLEMYNSIGVAVDLGASWTSHDGLLSAGMVIRNVGIQITTYAGEERESLPFEVQAGVSKRLSHAPFRFTITMRNLQKFDLTHQYDTASYQGAFGSAPQEKDGFTENLFRHLLFGVECLPHPNFWVGAGYNYQRRSELKVNSVSTTAGFSWGFGINLSEFRISFSRARYHLAGGSNQFALSFNPGHVYRKIAN